MKTKMSSNKMCAILGNLENDENLGTLTKKRPIATLPFDCKYRLVDFPLSSIANAHINEVLMLFDEKDRRSLMDHIQSGKEWNLDALQNHFFFYFYSNEHQAESFGLEYYGNLLDYLQKSKSQYTVVLGSKMLCNIDLRILLRNHKGQGRDITAVFKKVDSSQTGPHDRIFAINEPNGLNLIDAEHASPNADGKYNLCMDIYILETERLVTIIQQAEKQKKAEILPQLLKNILGDLQVNLYEYTGYLSNMNSISAFYQANMDMLNTTKQNALLYSNQKIYTKVKNEVPTYYSESSDVKNSQFATGCLIEGQVTDSIISRKVVIYNDAVVKNSILMPGCRILPGAVVEYAILDKNVIVDANTAIKGTAENPLVIEKNAGIRENVGGGSE